MALDYMPLPQEVPGTKIGPFANIGRPNLELMLEAGVRILKQVETLEHVNNFLDADPLGYAIGKVWVKQDNGQITDRPEEIGWDVDRYYRQASVKWARIKPEHRGRVFWNVTNEYSDWSQLGRMAQFEADVTYLAAKDGFRIAGGSFAVGTPDYPQWLEVYPLLQALADTGGIMSLHEYFAWTVSNYYGKHQEAWYRAPGRQPRDVDLFPDYVADEAHHLCRYRTVWDMHIKQFNVPIVIGEFGAGAGLGGGVERWTRPGYPSPAWKDFQDGLRVFGVTDSVDYYLKCIDWYDNQIRKDPYVLGAVLYTLPDDTAASPWDFRDHEVAFYARRKAISAQASPLR